VPEDVGLDAGVHLAGFEAEVVGVAEVRRGEFGGDGGVATEDAAVVELCGEGAVG